MDRKTFLLVTHSEDYYCIDLVAQHLKQRGCKAVRLNSDYFPNKYRFSWKFNNGQPGFQLQIGKKIITHEEVAAVWLRKLLFAPHDETVDAAYRNIVAGENKEICRSFLLRLSGYPSLDAFDRIEQAESKPLQQEYAVRYGLHIPASIITNSIAEAKALMQPGNKRYITKLLRPVSWGMNSEAGFFYTTFITKKDLSAAHFAVHPVQVQEFIPKQYELRIAYVAGQCFTGKILVEEYEADWRQPGKVNAWHPYQLPVAVGNKLSKLMKKLGLNFGAIDMIRGTDGKYYFLEVNPVGEWGMLEKFLHLPISEAIAQHLIKISGK
jgi:glutathione synthase/RimK-type ligase-like ATP-grasp enzyme